MLSLELIVATDEYELYGFRNETSKYSTEDEAVSFLALFPGKPDGIFVKLTPEPIGLTVCGSCATRAGRAMRVADAYLTDPRNQSSGYGWDGTIRVCERHGTRLGAYFDRPTHYWKSHWYTYDVKWRLHSETGPSLAACLELMEWEPLTAHLVASSLADSLNTLKKKIDSDHVRTKYKLPGQPVFRA